MKPSITSSNKSNSKSESTIPPLTDDPPSSQYIQGERTLPNLVLPTFEDTFHHPPRSFLPQPSIFQRTIKLVQALIYSNPTSSTFPQLVSNESVTGSPQGGRKASEILQHNHHISTRLPKSLDLLGVDKIQRVQKVQKVAILGIHGWFPGPWLESVLGKPTGTSKKFTSMMDNCLRNYIQEKLGGKELNQDFTRVINLEGDGRVDDRVDFFFNLLNNQKKACLDFITSADVIFVISHSQGCLVSCKLIEKLILAFGLNGSQFLSLSMCGIWNGPYVGLNNHFALQPVLKFLEGPAANELFEFQDHQSLASKALLKSFQNTLKYGVKYVLVGSMNDQVVPIYSSIHNAIDHPSILRAIFIDSAVYYSGTDFLTNLIVFCLRLRNSGFSDHGLIFLLSNYMVGSLTGVGHSTIYEDGNVFNLAVRYFFESSTPLEPPTYEPKPKEGQQEGLPMTSINELPDKLLSVNHTCNPRDKINPFLITWSLRGLIDDYKIKLIFHNELKFLKNSFLIWNPSSTNTTTNTTTTNNNNNQIHPASNYKILKELKIKLDPFREISLIDHPPYFKGSKL